MTKKQALIDELKDCVQSLSRALSLPKDEIVRDSSIKRFELASDICWKTLKQILFEDFGIEARSPKGTFREAYKQGLIEYEDAWIEMIDKRNETVHTYKEELAEEIYSQLPKFSQMMESLVKRLAA